MLRFDFGPLLQGQTRIAKLKSAYNLCIIGRRGLQCETNFSYRKSLAGNLPMSYLPLGTSFKVKQWFTGFSVLFFRWIQICICS